MGGLVALIPADAETPCGFFDGQRVGAAGLSRIVPKARLAVGTVFKGHANSPFLVIAAIAALVTFYTRTEFILLSHR